MWILGLKGLRWELILVTALFPFYNKHCLGASEM